MLRAAMKSLFSKFAQGGQRDAGEGSSRVRLSVIGASFSILSSSLSVSLPHLTNYLPQMLGFAVTTPKETPLELERRGAPVPHDFEAEPHGLFVLHPSPEVYLEPSEIDLEYVDPI